MATEAAAAPPPVEAPLDENDDNWLYGGADPDAAEKGGGGGGEPEPPAPGEEPALVDGAGPRPEREGNVDGGDDDDEDEERHNGDATEARLADEHFDEDDEEEGQRNGDSESDDSEDDVKVILGDIKSLPPQPQAAYPSLNIKRGGLVAQSGGDKQKLTGKFNPEDFESAGTINGVPAQEFNIDVLEDKPWRKPGADLTDYFNYGFDEDTWRAYCERQKRMRIHESGTGLVPLGGGGAVSGMQQPRHPTPILNDNSKYSVGFAGGARKAGPPPGRKLTGPIDVIGGRREGEDGPEAGAPKPIRENTIQVMTADRREYSRGKPYPDMSLPPPGGMPPPSDFFHDSDRQFYPPPPYQEEPWGNKSGWAPSDIKELTPGPMSGGPPPMGMPPYGAGPPPVQHPMSNGPPYGGGGSYGHVHHRDGDGRDRDMHRDRDKDDDDRDRDRSRSSKPDRSREKSHRRDRSRSRSRRHKSRSRSPSSRHRSKKKSSHRKDKEDSD